ncbi:hypothetical protein [Haloplanus halobius]|uniref:hypothetical protein n=1 Tax=Haloplanus halobius TaxID=2934938 RepID=UPI002010B3B7|nr:hypothetical protein [Haloplanus sp. XH21]
MDCPQCGGTLTTYALDGQEASVCEDCGYVGIPAEHRGDSRHVESWDDALRRFYRAHGTDEDPRVELQPPLSRPGDAAAEETWDDALRRFRERQVGTTDEASAGDETSDEKEETSDEDETAEAADGESTAGTEPEAAEQSASRPQSQSQSSAGDS